MKISLALGTRRPVSRQTAWGFLSANLALPGAGSLMAGRRVGYAQLGVALFGMVLTMAFGVRFIAWWLSNLSRFYGAGADPVPLLGEMWEKVRWALLGILAFGLGWLWGLATGVAVLLSAGRGEDGPSAPPRILP